MLVKSVRYLHQSAAERLHPEPNTAMISITGPMEGAAELQLGWSLLLRCQFEDSEYDERDIAFWNDKWNLVSKGRPKAENAIEILNFLDTIDQNGTIEHLVVHCHAGRSRSAAVAKFIAERYGLPFDHSYGAFNKTVYELLQNPERYKQFEAMAAPPIVKNENPNAFRKIARLFGF